MVDDRSSRLGLERSFKSNAIREIKNENYLEYRDYKVQTANICVEFPLPRIYPKSSRFQISWTFLETFRNVFAYIYSL